MSPITRRTTLLGAAVAFFTPPLIHARAGTKLPELVLHGPPAGPSITLAHAVASGALADIADKVSFRIWRTPDELRAGLTSGTMQVFVLPTQAAANLYNRGLGVKLVNVMTNGVLYVLTADPAVKRLSDLRERRVAIPFRNDTPDYLFRRLASAASLVPSSDLMIEYTGAPTEAAQLLMMGRVDAALVSEPAASAMIARAKQMGKEIHRAIDLQTEWGKLTGLGAVIPQAGLGVTTAFLEANRDLVEALHQAFAKATEQVNTNPADVSAEASRALDIPGPMVQQSIPHSNLVAIRARDARLALEAMYKTIAEFDAAAVGGRMPDAGFYL